ncbi:MAG: restriction endonuclease, partial [Geminicoccaceae bacterium]|nr:restriction endonuclease [Geminicoccaceae bacterium]
ETLMLPVLRVCGDGQEHATSNLVQRMADEFGLSENERRQTIPSGGATVIANRTHWAITYMAQARLLERPRRGFVRITERGRELLAKRPERIGNDVLNQYEEFVGFRLRSRSSARGSEDAVPRPGPERGSVPPQTPEERIRAASSEMESALRSELLERIRRSEPRFFEQLVVDLLVRMGYGSELGGRAEAIGRSGDGGIDGMIDQDPLGLDRVYVQAKRYASENSVGSPAILQFSGALAQRGATRGVFITTSRFTDDARGTAARLPQRIVLIDGEELARLLIRHDVGVRIAETVHIKKIDEDFFSEE